MNLLPVTKSILTEDQKLRVFVSSTLDELKEERSAVINAISDLKLHPVHFESGARPYPPRKVYSAAIEQSQIFIGIYWESYGWIIPGEEISGIEDEFLLAENKFKLIYIKNPDNERDAKLVELIQKIEASQSISYNKFNTLEELSKKVKNDIMTLLSENFGMDSNVRAGKFIGPSFTELLDQELNKKKIIDRRDAVNKIKDLIENNRKVLITGEPGIGKTYILGQISRENNSLYISIKGKTVYQVCSNLANHLAIRRNLKPKTLVTEEDAKSAFQEELANASINIILDDIDWNLEVYRSIVGLEFYDCRLVLACRAKVELQDENFVVCEIPPFSRDEVVRFLEVNNKTLLPGEVQRLLVSSGGNPLYLYYFVNYQVSPLPEGLTNYHLMLWEQLQPLQKEILNLIACSYASLSLSDFHELLNKENIVTKTLMETEAIIDSIQSLTRIIDKRVEIFHSYFEEFVLESISSLGVDAYYHLLLAEYALKRKWIVPSAVHLIKIGDTRVNGFVRQAISTAFLSSDWRTCQFLLNYHMQILENESNEEAEAEDRFFLSQILYEMGQYNDSKFQLGKAQDIFEKLGDEQSLRQIDVWSNFLFIQDGQIDKSISGFKKFIVEIDGKDDHQEAIMQVNLSYAYLQKSDFENGSIAAERALKLFETLSDDRGRYLAIVNLSCCVSGSGNYELQKKYAVDIINVAEKEGNLRLKAAGLNHIAIVYRRADELAKAEKVLLEAIQIAQKIGSFELEALNIANLGNVYLDLDNYLEAEKAYTESLNISKDHNIEVQEARALELLGRLKFRRHEYKLSKDLSEDALRLHKKFGDPLRLATTLNNLGQANEELGNERDAAENYEKAGDFYQDAKEWRDAAYSYRLATELWNKLEVTANLRYCVQEGFKCAFRENSPTIAQDILVEVSRVEDIENLDFLYQEIFNAYLSSGTNNDFAIFMRNFCSFCESNPSEKNTLMFRNAVLRMVDALADTPYTEIINALAITISQAAPRFFTISELDNISKALADKLDRLYFRILADEGLRVWTIGTKWSSNMIIQIEALSKDNIIARTSMALALVLFANNYIIEDDIKSFGHALESGVSLKIITQYDLESNTDERIHSNDQSDGVSHKDIQATISTTADFTQKPIPPMVLILHNDFEMESNFLINPGNKAYIWLLMIIHSGIVVQCLHEQRENIPGLSGKSREFCEKIFLVPTKK